MSIVMNLRQASNWAVLLGYGVNRLLDSCGKYLLNYLDFDKDKISDFYRETMCKTNIYGYNLFSYLTPGLCSAVKDTIEISDSTPSYSIPMD